MRVWRPPHEDCVCGQDAVWTASPVRTATCNIHWFACQSTHKWIPVRVQCMVDLMGGRAAASPARRGTPMRAVNTCLHDNDCQRRRREQALSSSRADSALTGERQRLRQLFFRAARIHWYQRDSAYRHAVFVSASLPPHPTPWRLYDTGRTSRSWQARSWSRLAHTRRPLAGAGSWSLTKAQVFATVQTTALAAKRIIAEQLNQQVDV
jgi:hypothetical protein